MLVVKAAWIEIADHSVTTSPLVVRPGTLAVCHHSSLLSSLGLHSQNWTKLLLLFTLAHFKVCVCVVSLSSRVPLIGTYRIVLSDHSRCSVSHVMDIKWRVVGDYSLWSPGLNSDLDSPLTVPVPAAWPTWDGSVRFFPLFFLPVLLFCKPPFLYSKIRFFPWCRRRHSCYRVWSCQPRLWSHGRSRVSQLHTITTVHSNYTILILDLV